MSEDLDTPHLCNQNPAYVFGFPNSLDWWQIFDNHQHYLDYNLQTLKYFHDYYYFDSTQSLNRYIPMIKLIENVGMIAQQVNKDH